MKQSSFLQRRNDNLKVSFSERIHRRDTETSEKAQRLVNLQFNLKPEQSLRDLGVLCVSAVNHSAGYTLRGFFLALIFQCVKN